MYIPSKSGHQKHTIRNFISGELRWYGRICTQEISFLRIRNKFFKRLRVGDTKNSFWKDSLGKWSILQEILFSNFHLDILLRRNSIFKEEKILLLKMPKKYSMKLFQTIILNPMENVLNRDISTNSVDFPQCNVVPYEVCYYSRLLLFYFQIKTLKHKCMFLFFLCFNRFQFWKVRRNN